jgi:hypothetical protein
MMMMSWGKEDSWDVYLDGWMDGWMKKILVVKKIV